MGKGVGMKNFSLTLGLIAGILMTGCSRGNDVAPLELQVAKVLRGVIAGKFAGKSADRPPLTRATLNGLPGSFLEVILERSGQLAYLYVSAERRDSQPGKITVWRTEDNVSVVMRNGVLIGMQGLGGAMVSSSAMVRGNQPGPAHSGERIQFFRNLDNKKTRVVMACDVVDLGAETIVIVERNHATRHVQERCKGSGGTVVNDYWIDSRAGLVWRSRQWAGPNVGYLVIRRLTK